ncbi:MAG: GDSL-type esterase/lipase family protein [Bacteroidota bacterium]
MQIKFLFSFFFAAFFMVQAQQSNGFYEEVLAIQRKNDVLWDSEKETIVFTGSSSIRLWNDLEERFPDQHILNSGFGGSQADDLLIYLNELVLRHHPKKVVIYEGDNDIFRKKRPQQIIRVFEEIIQKIWAKNKDTQIILISVKPSISRWRLRGKYKRLNKRLKKLANTDTAIQFVNVWDIMLNGNRLNKTLFIEDGLHMNALGYDLWYKALKGHIN